jgi:adenylylsulfate kinase
LKGEKLCMTSSMPPSSVPTPGTVVFISGLPSSGKSKLAKNLRAQLLARDVRALILDGDEVREALVPKPGYSESERLRFYEILGNLAAALARQGLCVLVAATAHRRAFREHARRVAPRFLEVWVDVPLDECRRRDKKGLYARFRSGELHDVPGEDIEYEAPEQPDMIATGGNDTAAIRAVTARLTNPSLPPPNR